MGDWKCSHRVEAQVPEKRLHEDLSQVGVRVTCGSVVSWVGGRRWPVGSRLHLGAISWTAVAQQRGHVGVVLQAGQDDVQLHPLEVREQQDFQFWVNCPFLISAKSATHKRNISLNNWIGNTAGGTLPVLWRDSPICLGPVAAESEATPSSPSVVAVTWWLPPTASRSPPGNHTQRQMKPQLHLMRKDLWHRTGQTGEWRLISSEGVKCSRRSLMALKSRFKMFWTSRWLTETLTTTPAFHLLDFIRHWRVHQSKQQVSQRSSLSTQYTSSHTPGQSQSQVIGQKPKAEFEKVVMFPVKTYTKDYTFIDTTSWYPSE